MEKSQEQISSMGRQFVQKLMDGKILEASRPNKAPEYTGAYEQLDLLEYRRFLSSYTYSDLFVETEAEYGQY